MPDKGKVLEGKKFWQQVPPTPLHFIPFHSIPLPSVYPSIRLSTVDYRSSALSKYRPDLDLFSPLLHRPSRIAHRTSRIAQASLTTSAGRQINNEKEKFTPLAAWRNKRNGEWALWLLCLPEIAHASTIFFVLSLIPRCSPLCSNTVHTTKHKNAKPPHAPRARRDPRPRLPLARHASLHPHLHRGAEAAR